MRRSLARIYISIRYSDQELAHQIASGLEKQGHVLVSDMDVIPAGDHWKNVLMQELKSFDAAVYLLSGDGVNSPHILSEIRAARAFAAASGRMLIITVVLDKVLRLSPGLRQRVKTLLAVRCKIIDRQISLIPKLCTDGDAGHLSDRRRVGA
ncbi:MAG: TIR domain-containing protein [Acidobacteria bacterium]|nr:TIR domain-containing protein [Acidobacteriota bacterium]